MPLRKIREERKRLGVGASKGPRTVTMVLLLAVVLLLILWLGRVG
jgi:hypothetical protein